MYLLFNILLMNLKHSANKAICEQFIWTGFLDFVHSFWLEIFNGYSNNRPNDSENQSYTALFRFQYGLVRNHWFIWIGIHSSVFVFFLFMARIRLLYIYLVNLFGICISLCILISMFSVRSWNKSWCHANIIFRLEQYKQYINIS